TIQPPTLNQLLQAIKAGADMILISLPYKEQMQAMEFMKHAVLSGKLSESRLHGALNNINRLKKQYIPKEIPSFDESASYTKQSQLLMRQISKQCYITLHGYPESEIVALLFHRNIK